MEKLFFTSPNQYTLLSFDIVAESEKAIKCEVVSYAISGGGNDQIGSFKGFAWIPKKAVLQTKDADKKKLAPWFELKCFATKAERAQWEIRQIKAVANYNAAVLEMRNKNS